MFVIIDMLFAVTIVPLAPGAIAEFQLRIAYIRPAAYGTPMGVGIHGFGRLCVGGEGDRAGLLFLLLWAGS